MRANNQRLSTVSGRPDGEAGDGPARPPRREIAAAIIVVALLLTGVAVGAARAPRPEQAVAAQSAGDAAQPPQEFIYFPSQYVNQGAEIPEPIPTF